VRYPRVLALAALAAVATGCTGIELVPLGAAALSAGVGNVVKAGTEYTLTGTAYRTFSVPLEDLALVTRRTRDRLVLPVAEAAVHDTRLTLIAEGIDRTVKLTFTPISASVTRLGVTVKRGPIVRDRATTSEIVAQIELAVLPIVTARNAADAARHARDDARSSAR
jgi:hypothetical protein